MKKLLLAAAATAAFSSSAMAGNEFYLRADAGINMWNKNKYNGIKLEEQYLPSMELGAGYYVMDDIRAELAYGYHFNFINEESKDFAAGELDPNEFRQIGERLEDQVDDQQSQVDQVIRNGDRAAIEREINDVRRQIVALQGNLTDANAYLERAREAHNPDTIQFYTILCRNTEAAIARLGAEEEALITARGYTPGGDVEPATDGVTPQDIADLTAAHRTEIKIKTTLQTFMLKGFYDAFDLGRTKVFVGAGIGFATIKPTITTTITDANSSYTTSRKAKSKTNFSYLLALGTSFDAADSVKIDLQYNFQDFGKSKYAKTALRSHAIKAGVRFAL